MALAWFIAPYNRKVGAPHPMRYCAMDDFTAQILADGGNWEETEVLGSVALVKVNASATTLTTIGVASGFVRLLLKTALTDSLTDLTAGQRTTITNKLLSMGYSQTEINAAMGGTLTLWRGKTFATLLNLIATRRLQPRYDVGTDTIVCDGPVQPVRPITDVDAKVK